MDGNLEKSESDSDSNDKIESDIVNDGYDKLFVESILIVCLNHTLLGFYFRQSV